MNSSDNPDSTYMTDSTDNTEDRGIIDNLLNKIYHDRLTEAVGGTIVEPTLGVHMHRWYGHEHIQDLLALFRLLKRLDPDTFSETRTAILGNLGNLYICFYNDRVTGYRIG